MFVELVGDYTQQLRRVGGDGWWNLDLAWLKEAPLQPAEIRRPYLWDFEL